MGTQREEVVVRAGFDNTALASGVRQAQAYVTKGFGDISRTIAGAFSAGAIISGINAVINKFDDLKDRADNLEVSTDFLQGMSHIAGKDAVGGVQSFNKGITELSAKLGDAKSGGDEAIKKFEKWGITLKEIQNLDTEAMFYRIATTLKDIPDPAIRSAAAFDLLGKAGKNMAGVMAAGGDALKNMSDAVYKLDAEKVKELADAKDSIEEAYNYVTIFGGKILTGVGAYYRFMGRLSTGWSTMQKAAAEEDYQRTLKLIEAKKQALSILPTRLSSEDTSGGVSKDDYERREQLLRETKKVGKYDPKAMSGMFAELQGIQDKIDLKNAPTEEARMALRRQQTARDLRAEGNKLGGTEAERTAQQLKIEALSTRLKALDAEISDNRKNELAKLAANAAKQTAASEKLAGAVQNGKVLVQIPSK